MVKEQYFLKPETIYNFLMGDEELETAIYCKTEELELWTSDQNLYEALGTIEDRRSISYDKFVKLLESVNIVSHQQSEQKMRDILTHERVVQIRKLAKKEQTLNKVKGGE